VAGVGWKRASRGFIANRGLQKGTAACDVTRKNIRYRQRRNFTLY
jgi:hypothetical protein